MKIHAYELDQRDGYSFVETLEALHKLPHDDRYLDAHPGDLRLEDLQIRDGWLFADFVKRRDHGPGRLRAGRPIEGFQLNVGGGDAFGEETGFLLGPDRRWVIVQYNHYGPRAPTIADYVDQADAVHLHPGRDAEPVFSFAIVLQRDAYARLQAMEIYRSLDVKISLPAVSAHDRERGRPLSSVLQAPMGGVETITIHYGTELRRDSSLTPDGVMGVVNQARRMGDAVKRLVVRGKPAQGERMEQIDLFNDRLTATVDVQIANDGRYPRERRRSALRRQYQVWKAAGALHGN